MKKGFTVAEIIVTLVIVGVIAALITPAFSLNIGAARKKETITKGYSVIANAYNVEFAVTPMPASPDEDQRVLDAINKNMNIKYYLLCNGGKCEQKFQPQSIDAWIVTEDNIAFKVIKGENNCADKTAMAQIANSLDATKATCFAILIDSGCIASYNNESRCSEIEDGTPELAKKIKDNKFQGDQVRVFATSTGITAGNPDTVAAGIITAEE